MNPKAKSLIPRAKTKTWQEMLQALTGVDLTICPNCGQGRLIRCRLIGSEATPCTHHMGFLMTYCCCGLSLTPPTHSAWQGTIGTRLSQIPSPVPIRACPLPSGLISLPQNIRHSTPHSRPSPQNLRHQPKHLLLNPHS